MTSRKLEVHAPLATARIRTLERLRAEGIPTYAFIGPLLPHFRLRPDLLDDLFKRLAAAGVDEVFVEHMNLKPYIRQRLITMLGRYMPEAVALYTTDIASGREEMKEMVSSLLAKYSLRLRLGTVLQHGVNS
jgi:DNA repair photolyase